MGLQNSSAEVTTEITGSVNAALICLGRVGPQNAYAYRRSLQDPYFFASLALQVIKLRFSLQFTFQLGSKPVL